MKHNRRTVADLRALKGKRQLTMLYVESLEEALEQAGAIGAEIEVVPDRVAAFQEYAADVAGGAYPAAQHPVGIAEEEFAAFMERLERG